MSDTKPERGLPSRRTRRVGNTPQRATEPAPVVQSGLDKLRRRPVQIDRITLNPAVMGGKPCIRGLRVTVVTILGLLASGESRERILQAYPYLEPEVGFLRRTAACA